MYLWFPWILWSFRKDKLAFCSSFDRHPMWQPIFTVLFFPDTKWLTNNSVNNHHICTFKDRGWWKILLYCREPKHWSCSHTLDYTILISQPRKFYGGDMSFMKLISIDGIMKRNPKSLYLDHIKLYLNIGY